MKTTLEFLVELIGARKAEVILQSYIKKNWKGSMDQDSESAPAKHHRRRNVLGAKRWTESEKVTLVEEVKHLRDQGYSNYKIHRTLSESHHRTPSAIFNMVGKLNL